MLTMDEADNGLVVEIFGTLNLRFKHLNKSLHYEAGWTESWNHLRCWHDHETIQAAAECATPHGAGWYVFAVENGTPRQLQQDEEDAERKFRFKTASA
jgi:hypothetical protein